MIKLVANADEEQKSVSKKANDEYHSVYNAAWKKYKKQLKQQMKSTREIVRLPRNNAKNY